MKLNPGFGNFLIRLGIFLTLFVLITGIIGPWVVGSKLLYGYGFFIYGNLGKLVIYSAIVFLLLVKDRLPEAEKITMRNLNWPALIMAIVLTGGFFPLARFLLTTHSPWFNWPLTLVTHAVAVLIPTCLLLAVFPWKYLRLTAKKYLKPILVCLTIAAIFDLTIFQVWKLWPIFSQAVLVAVKWLFSLSFAHVYSPAPLTLYVNGFGIKILQACSGLDSLFLFSALYVLIGILDWKKFNHKKLILMFFPSAVGLFGVNILRVYLIILAGILISPEITVQLFHTYAGMLLFIGYFGLFWGIFYKKIKNSY